MLRPRSSMSAMLPDLSCKEQLCLHLQRKMNFIILFLCPYLLRNAKSFENLGAEFLHKFGADFFCLFFSGFHPPERLASIFQRKNVQTGFYADFGCADSCADFGAQIFAQILGAQTFAQIFRRFTGARKIGVPESRKNVQRICGKICGVPMALPGWVPYSISIFSSRQHVTQSPPAPCTPENNA